MKALIQRVTHAAVRSDQGEAAIGRGFVILLGVRQGDTQQDLDLLVRKTCHLRIFEDADGRMNRSLTEVDGELLVVSQFTLYADTRKGNRPSFIQAAPPGQAQTLYNAYVAGLRAYLGESHVKTGWFGAKMQLEIHNDGPVTIELCSDSTDQPAAQQLTGTSP